MPSVLIAISRLHCMDGVSSNLATLMPALTRNGWDPHFVVGSIDCPPGHEERLEAIRSASVSFIEEPLLASRDGLSMPLVWRQSRFLRRRTNETGAGVLHLRGRVLGPAATLCRLSGGVGTVNVPPLAPSEAERLRRRHAMLTGRLLGDRVVAISREMATLLRDAWGVPSGRIRHVPHGTNLDQFRPPTAQEEVEARRKLGLPEQAFVVLQLARVGGIKRPDTVVDAVAMLVDEGRDALAVFGGFCTEADHADLMAHAAKLNVAGRVRILGEVDARTALWAADAKVLASEREGFGIAVVEAMACGLPVIRTPVEGAADQIEDGVTGLLFSVGDAAELAVHLRRVADDRAWSSQLGSAAARRARDRFSDDSMAQGVCLVYEELL